MQAENVFQINLYQIIREKAPKHSGKIPGFLIHWLSRLIHEKGLNDFLIKNGNATGVDFMQNAVQYFDITLHIEGKENIPSPGKKYIFVSNHPLGGLDGICLSALLGSMYDKKIRYLVNDILYFIKPLQTIFVPINKHGSQAKRGAQAINDAFASENQIITFPAGLCSRKQRGKIRDLEWKKMFIIKAIEYQRDVIPVYFEARNSKFFYRLANFRKALGIKFNIEMLFLPREMFKAKGSSFTIHFSKPIPWQTFDTSKSPQEWAEWVKNNVYDTEG